MGIHLFCGNPREDEHEWKQLVEICKNINQNYDKTKPIFLLYNFNLSPRCQIDLLIIQEKGISILELKSYNGEVIGNDYRNVKWSVKTESGEIKLPVNVFTQLSKEGSMLRNKLEQLRKKIFPNIEEDDMKKIQCWGYFEKGSNYVINQLPAEYHIWFDVITGEDLIRKLSFVNTGYKLDEKDMITIKDHFNLGDCPEDDPELSFLFIDKLEKTWLPKLMEYAKDYHKQIKNEMIEKGEIKEDGKWILNLKTRIFDDGKPSNKTTAIKSLDDILKLSNYSVITGFAGTGKSVFLHQFYEKIIQKETQYKIPLYISLREIQQYKSNEQLLFNYKNNELVLPSEKDLSDKFLLEISKLIVYSYFENLTKDEDLIKRKEVYLILFEKLVKENYFVFCLDGYDELATTKNLVDNWISFLFRENISFLLTTRPIVLTRLQKILGTQGLHYYWLLLPNEQETRQYLENRAKKLGFTSSEFNYKDLTPLQLSIRSLFPIKLVIDKNQEFEFQIYGLILWEVFKHNLSVISKIKSTDDIIKLLKSEIVKRKGKKHSVYDLIKGPIDRQYSKTDLQNDASIMGVCGELAYLSYSGKIDSEYAEKLYKENPYNPLIVDFVTLPEITKSIVYFNKPQLRDFFAAQYIYSLYKQGKIVPLINSDIMKMLQNLLEERKPWLQNNDLLKFGNNSNEITTKYLLSSPIKLIPTETLPDSMVVDHLTIMGRTRLGVPGWYSDLVNGILHEISKENDPIRNEQLTSGLMSIIQKIPEFSIGHAYDVIIKDWDYENFSTSVEPYQYSKQIKELFPEFNKPLEKHLQDFFVSLDKLPENGLCPACEIESSIKKRDNDELIYTEEDDFEDINERIDYLMDLTYTFKLSHNVDGNPTMVYLLNLLESDIDTRIKNFLMLANKHDDLGSFKGLLRHRADYSDDDYLQYIASGLIGVAQTKQLAFYAITIWESLLYGMDADAGAHIPGPKIIPEFAINSIRALLKRELLWEDIIEILFSMILKSDKYPELGILLFKEIKEFVDEETFRRLIFELISNVMYSKGERIQNQIDCLKGFEDIWLPILFESDDKGLSYLSQLDLSNYDLTEDDIENLYSLVRSSFENKKELDFNPKILIFLHEKDFPVDWTDFFTFLGESEEIDSFFRKIIPTKLTEQQIITYIDEIENNNDKLLVALVSRLNLDYLEDFMKGYFFSKNSINKKSLFQKWLLKYINEKKSPSDMYKLETQLKRWLFKEPTKINFLESILSNVEINFDKLNELFDDTNFYYSRDYYLEIEKENKLKIKEFWEKNNTEKILENILGKMIETANEKYTLHKYWIKYLFPYIDAFAKLEDSLFNYITSLLSFDGPKYYDNNLIFYLNENPHKKFQDLFYKAIENITQKKEINNAINALVYRIYFVDDESIIYKKKELRINSKKEEDYFKKVISLIINKDIELLEKSIYSRIEFHNFELIDLASRLNDSSICHYIKKLVLYDISDYYIDQLLDAIEKDCKSALVKEELEEIMKRILKEIEIKNEKGKKWEIERLEELLKRCKNLL